MTKKKFIQHVYSLHGLTPLQRVVFAAFDDGKARDRVTIAMHLDGHHTITTRSKAMRIVADEALKQLVIIGLVRVDEFGWCWRIEAAAIDEVTP